jgi:hypothetical protein
MFNTMRIRAEPKSLEGAIPFSDTLIWAEPKSLEGAIPFSGTLIVKMLGNYNVRRYTNLHVYLSK